MHYRYFCLLMAAVVVLGFGGCGGEGKSSDPLGTDSLTFGDSSGSAVLDLDTNGAVQLTARVKDAAGKDVADREVFFDIFPNGSGATLSSGKVVTNATGEATVLYRAGGSPGSDVVRAFISNETHVDVSITVGGGISGTRVSLAAAPSSLAARQSSILTATVTNSAGSPLQGQAVTFALTNNNSAASLVTVNGTTDVSGKAVAVYTAGAANPTEDVQDTVQAGVPGSADALVITRTADGAAGGENLSIAASATSLAAGQLAVITATVTDGASAPVAGRTVTFSFTANNSGAALITLSGTTDVSGKAIAQYTAGANSPSLSVQDTVLASIPGSAGAVVLTRTVGTATGFQIAATATPTSLVAEAISIITATVTNADGTAAQGRTVTFNFIGGTPSGATLTPINNGITDVSGRALAVYRAGAANPTETVQDVVLARVTGTAAAVVITRQAASITGNRISSLTALPSTLPSATGGISSITATVIGGTGGLPIAGVPVTFDVFTGAGSVTSSAVTGNNGRANAVFTGPPQTAGAQSVVRATIDGGDAVVIITWGP